MREPPSLTQAKWFREACVASPHYLATAAGLEVLSTGGNAMDAAIATNLALGVVTPYLCGFGGDLFALVWKDGPIGYNGSGRAPAAATTEAMRRAAAGSSMPTYGPLTVTVPGAVEGWFALLARLGTRTFGDVAEPALRLAQNGFMVSQHAAASFAAARERFRGFEEWQSVHAEAREGKILRLPNLVRTIEALATDGPDVFYRGPIAAAIVDHVQWLGGLISRGDLQEHRGEWVEPLRTTYRTVEVLELPPNSQGVAALEALNILQAAGPMPPDGAERQHLLIEAMKMALVDRDAYVTDPDYMKLPPEKLLSTEWTKERVQSFDPKRADHPAGFPAAAGGTAYMCAADRDGMLVSLIQSNWMGFGSGVSVPGWGINLHNRGNYFSLNPDHSNVVAPGKRTLHTLVPGMALRGGRPWLAFGSMGGDGQAQTHEQLLARIIDDGADIQSAIAGPRWVMTPTNWDLTAESRFDPDVIEGLRDRGHNVTLTDPYDSTMGHAHAVQVADTGYLGAADPRSEGAVSGT